jgi:hypothetical protein
MVSGPESGIEDPEPIALKGPAAVGPRLQRGATENQD